ncbi:MAG: hypothetical protein AABZ14_04460, partial [Candidatus Margulisiibacteriota bacterium]
MRLQSFLLAGLLFSSFLWAEGGETIPQLSELPVPINITQSSVSVEVPQELSSNLGISANITTESISSEGTLEIIATESSEVTEDTRVISDHSTVRTIFRRSGELESFQVPASRISLSRPTRDVDAKTQTSSFWRDFRWEDWDEQPAKDLVRITPYMSGFGEIKLYSMRLNGNRNEAVKDALYVDLMRKMKEVDFLIESRFNLLLQARINDEADVNYTIVQEPNIPQKTDVNLRIRKTFINFGDMTKDYSVGTFTNLSKRIDGVSVKGSEGPFSYNFGF